ncbi:hypothetical protein HK102_002927 [Quaeritorhiza haematococci]|nr:hypothetical protein HK102_002927 [Quaeritorhiza haematococci]
MAVPGAVPGGLLRVLSAIFGQETLRSPSPSSVSSFQPEPPLVKHVRLLNHTNAPSHLGLNPENQLLWTFIYETIDILHNEHQKSRMIRDYANRELVDPCGEVMNLAELFLVRAFGIGEVEDAKEAKEIVRNVLTYVEKKDMRSNKLYRFIFQFESIRKQQRHLRSGDVSGFIRELKVQHSPLASVWLRHRIMMLTSLRKLVIDLKLLETIIDFRFPVPLSCERTLHVNYDPRHTNWSGSQEKACTFFSQFSHVGWTVLEDDNADKWRYFGVPTPAPSLSELRMTIGFCAHKSLKSILFPKEVRDNHYREFFGQCTSSVRAVQFAAPPMTPTTVELLCQNALKKLRALCLNVDKMPMDCFNTLMRACGSQLRFLELDSQNIDRRELVVIRNHCLQLRYLCMLSGHLTMDDYVKLLPSFSTQLVYLRISEQQRRRMKFKLTVAVR